MTKLPDIFQRLRLTTTRSKSSVALIVIAGLVIEVMTATMYWFASRGIREEVKHRAESELKVKSLEIKNVMTAVESAVDNSVWAVEQQLDQPDSLINIASRLAKQNSTIVGAGLLFVADYYPEKGHWFEPYAAKRENGIIETSQIGGADHDYLKADWYHKAINKGRGYWSDPYYDEAGAKAMLCSYFLPVRDKKGRIVALLAADVSLDWLSSIVNARQIYPSSFNVMISRTGQLMACPAESLVIHHTIQEATQRIEDTTANYINRQMMAGESGHADLIDANGERKYIFYAPVEGDAGWSMAVVCKDSEIFHDLRKVGYNLQIQMLIGLLLMGYIIWRSIRNANRLEATQSQKAAMENELHIANAIQVSLLPKPFGADSDHCNDLDICASLTPARQVGGDLYDYHIRDEKLFFCIGDVSGKGVPASLVMAVTRTLFRSVTAHESRPNRILSAINNTLSEDNPDNMFVTLFVGVLDLPTGRLRYANAGHEAPVCINKPCKDDTAANAVEKLTVDPNIPLGTMSGWEFTHQETTLTYDSMLFLYTDGLTEATNPDGQMFGRQGMMEALAADSAGAIVDKMKKAVNVFTDGAEQHDDLTMLAIHYTRQQYVPIFHESIVLPNDVQTIPQLADFVEKVCQTLNLDMSLTMQMNLAVEEAVVNVMNYAYPKNTLGEVMIEATANKNRLKFTISDSGVPFDPTAQPKADTTLAAEDRPIGGLGIYLVRHYMDSINYERQEGRNVLTLRKRLIINKV